MAISRRSLLKHLPYTLVLPSLAYVFSACTKTQSTNNSNGNNQTPTDSEAAVAANQAEGEPIPIRIAYPAAMNGQIAKVMEQARIAEKKGLEAEYTFFQNGPPMMEAFASGDVDAVITSPMPVINFISRNPGKAVVVASLGNSSYSLMVPQDSSIQQVNDLQGKTIALSYGSDSHLDLLKLLEESNLESDVKLLNTPPNELQLAFERGFADAIVIRQPQVLKLQKDFNAQIIQTWPHRYISVMRTDYLERYPQAEKQYLEALRESILFTATNKEQASIWFSEQIRLDPEIIRQVSQDDPNYTVTKLEDVSVEVTPAIKQILEDWARFSYEAGITKKEIAWDWR